MHTGIKGRQVHPLIRFLLRSRVDEKSADLHKAIHLCFVPGWRNGAISGVPLISDANIGTRAEEYARLCEVKFPELLVIIHAQDAWFENASSSCHVQSFRVFKHTEGVSGFQLKTFIHSFDFHQNRLKKVHVKEISFVIVHLL